MPNNKPLSVVWSNFKKYYKRVVDNAEDASKLINELKQANLNPPPMVEFFEPRSGRALAIGVGRTDTVVTFQESTDPPYYISLGRLQDEGVTWYCYGCEESEYLKQNIIPFNLGFEALLFFVEFRTQPPGIEWECL